MKHLLLIGALACTSPDQVGEDVRAIVEAGVEEGIDADQLARRVGHRPVIDTRRSEDRTAIRIADYQLGEGSELPMSMSDHLVYWIEKDDRLVGALYRGGRPTFWQARILPP